MSLKVRHWAHYAAGIVSAFSSLVSPALPAVGVVCFLVYEIKQDRDTGSVSFLDIYEYCVGYYIAAAVLIGLKIMGVL